jgi:hypothetical protein
MPDPITKDNAERILRSYGFRFTATNVGGEVAFGEACLRWRWTRSGRIPQSSPVLNAMRAASLEFAAAYPTGRPRRVPPPCTGKPIEPPEVQELPKTTAEAAAAQMEDLAADDVACARRRMEDLEARGAPVPDALRELAGQ